MMAMCSLGATFELPSTTDRISAYFNAVQIYSLIDDKLSFCIPTTDILIQLKVTDFIGPLYQFLIYALLLK